VTHVEHNRKKENGIRMADENVDVTRKGYAAFSSRIVAG
jgi:hypothetical protein